MSIFDRLSPGAREVLKLAQREANGLRHNYLGTEHLVLGLIIVKAPGLAGLSLDTARAAVVGVVGRGDGGKEPLPRTPRLQEAFRQAELAASSEQASEIDNRHLVAGLVGEGAGVGMRVLLELGVDLEGLAQTVPAFGEVTASSRGHGGKVEFAEIVERLSGLAGQGVWVHVWSNSDKRDLIAGLTGTLEQAQSDAGRAAQRAGLVEQMQASGLPREVAEEEVLDLEEQLDAARRAYQAGEPLPDEWGSAIVAVGTDSGRRQHFMLLRGGRRVGDIWITESGLSSAEYDQHGLTLRYEGATLTFMNVYRPRGPKQS